MKISRSITLTASALLIMTGVTATHLPREAQVGRLRLPDFNAPAPSAVAARPEAKPAEPLPSHYVHNPEWWTERGILVEGAAPNHYGPANLGQLKHITRGAILEMEEHLPGGAGSELLGLLAAWDAKPKQESHFSPANQGQLKNLASKVYDRLIAEGRAEAYPWTPSPSDDSNYSPVNLGQLKFVFSFDLTCPPSEGIARVAQ